MTPAKESDEYNTKWIVTHYGARDSYQIPLAFYENGSLEKFVTDYYSGGTLSGVETLGSKYSSRMAQWKLSRCHPLLPPTAVADQKLLSFARLLTRRWTGDGAWDRHLGRRAGQLAVSKGSAVFSTSYYGSSLFTTVPKSTPKVLFQIHPQPRFLRNLYRTYLSSHNVNSGLASEPEFSCSEATLDEWELESELADHIVVASQFSKRSLLANGIPEAKISVAPYGIDTAAFTPRLEQTSGPVVFLFVGSKIARKGLGLLLQAWEQLNTKAARLVIAGANARDAHLMEPFKGSFEELPKLTHQELLAVYRLADALVLPSLAEGFGHVYLEALASGTPIIGTENSAALDLVDDRINGRLIAADSVDSIAEALEWFIRNRNNFHYMRMKALQTAERNRWSTFRRRVREAAGLATHQRPSMPAASSLREPQQ